jgi:hypothetical protein
MAINIYYRAYQIYSGNLGQSPSICPHSNMSLARGQPETETRYHPQSLYFTMNVTLLLIIAIALPTRLQNIETIGALFMH